MTSISSAHLTCLCGSISAPGSLLASTSQTLPVDAEVCHCNSCRHSSGALGTPFVRLTSAPKEEVLGNCTAYHSSGVVTRYFCERCGCHVFLCHEHENENQWFCLGGIIEPKGGGDGERKGEAGGKEGWVKDVVRIQEHIFITDTVDGGLAGIWLELGGRNIATWNGYPKEGAKTFDLPHADIFALPAKSVANLDPSKEGDFLKAECRCGGVSLLIKRAVYGPEEKARYIPKDRTKYLTYMCACRSCRLSTGVSLVPWTTLPLSSSNAYILNDNSPSKIPVIFSNPGAETNPGLTLKIYQSSANVLRSFCGKCGATVGYWSAEHPGEVDLVTGIFRAREGAMARGWCEWDWGRCSFAEEGVDEEILKAWKECGDVMDVKGWRAGRGRKGLGL